MGPPALGGEVESRVGGRHGAGGVRSLYCRGRAGVRGTFLVELRETVVRETRGLVDAVCDTSWEVSGPLGDWSGGVFGDMVVFGSVAGRARVLLQEGGLDEGARGLVNGNPGRLVGRGRYTQI